MRWRIGVVVAAVMVSFSGIARAQSVDPCQYTPADAIFHVPEFFHEQSFVARDGRYWYRPEYAAGPCRSFVVDLMMATNSNDNGHPDLNDGINVEMFAHNLPSSGGVGALGHTPTNEIDCNQHYAKLSWYRCLGSCRQFQDMGATEFHGVWFAGSCVVGSKNSTLTPPTPVRVRRSDVGFDRHRFAVRVRQRASGQQVRLRLFQPPPQ